MYTEVGFEIGSDEYVIKRGMKPHVFEVIKNGQALDQDAASRDQQKYIETVILKTSFKPFTQVIMLGSA